MKPVVRMYGAKWRLAPWIVKHFPPHHVYVEAFGGSAAVLLSKEPSPVEVYNDLDGEVVNFFRVLREQPEDLARAIAFTPYARSELDTAWEPTADPLEAARRFAVRSWMTIGGPTTRWKSGFRFRKGRRMAVLLRWWQEMPERLAAVAFRLRAGGAHREPGLPGNPGGFRRPRNAVLSRSTLPARYPLAAVAPRRVPLRILRSRSPGVAGTNHGTSGHGRPEFVPVSPLRGHPEPGRMA